MFQREKLKNAPLWKVSLIFFKVIVCIFLLVNILLVKWIFSNKAAIVKSDYPHYYLAGLLARKGEGQFLYNLDVNREYQSRAIKPYKKPVGLFRNPPFASLVYLPFSLLAFFQSYLVFAIFNIILLFLITFLSSKIFNNFSKSWLIYLLPFAYYPNGLSVLKGQISIFVAVVFLIFYLLFKKGSFWAGAVYSLLLVKPQFYLVGLPFFLIISKDRKKFITGVFMSTLLIFLTSIFIAGWETVVNYPYFLFSTETSSFGSYIEVMFSLNNFFSYLIEFLRIENIWAYIFQLVLYLFTFFVFLKRRNFASYDSLFLSATIFTGVFAIHVLPYDLSFTFVAILILLNYAFASKKRNSMLALFLATLMFILPNLEVFGVYAFSPLLLFLITLYILRSDLLNLRK